MYSGSPPQQKKERYGDGNDNNNSHKKYAVIKYERKDEWSAKANRESQK